jgi:hypothetical protein
MAIHRAKPGEGEHQGRPDDPVEDQGNGHQLAVGGDLADPGVADLGQHRVHHRQQPDRDRKRNAADLDRVEPVVQVGDQASQNQAGHHGSTYPHREEAVECGQPSEDGLFDGCSGIGHEMSIGGNVPDG